LGISTGKITNAKDFLTFKIEYLDLPQRDHYYLVVDTHLEGPIWMRVPLGSPLFRGAYHWTRLYCRILVNEEVKKY
jgi:hypothetical protein